MPQSQRPASAIPRYYHSLDFEQLWQEFPPAPEYFDERNSLSRDALRALQNARFLTQIKRAWEIPFYQRHWRATGMAPGDIRSLEDLVKIPPFSVHDLREASGRNPPWGDFIGLDPARDAPLPLVLQTSGGTTGLPRPMLYAPRDRETMAIMGGRRFALHGVRPGDMVLVTYALGLSNGAA